MSEELYLKCMGCGEVFDELKIAKSHSDEAPGLSECGNNEWEILLESEAF